MEKAIKVIEFFENEFGELSESQKTVLSEILIEKEKPSRKNLIEFGNYWSINEMGNNGTVDYMVDVYLETITNN